MNSSLLLRLVYLGCIIASTICAVSFELTPFRQAMTEPVGGSAARKQEQGDDGVRTAPSHPEKRIALVHIGPFKVRSEQRLLSLVHVIEPLPMAPLLRCCLPTFSLALSKRRHRPRSNTTFADTNRNWRGTIGQSPIVLNVLVASQPMA